MARLLFVAPQNQPGLELPPAFQLLPHKIIVATDLDQVLREHDDHQVVLVDGRCDLAGARTMCQALIEDGPRFVLLVVTTDALPVLSGQWGAADFVLETSSPAELDTRIRLLLERPTPDSTLSGGPVVIDEGAYTATVNGRSLDLTYTEFELLKYLVQHPGRVLSREQLLSAVWGYDFFHGTRTVDVHIRRLRAKLGPEFDYCIGTVRNVGYRFNMERT